MQKTSGDIFVRFLVIGLIALIMLIVGVKTYTTNSDLATLTLAGTIFVVNLLIVAGYTLAVINNAEMLKEEDAPDLAYYLGFSLTVASLAVSFISDVGLASDAAAKSNLVKGSLAQFGAGLLATLIGLISKILITSKQTLIATNPTQLYQEFRTEIRNFESEMEKIATTLSNSIKSACNSMQASAESAAASMEQLSEKLKSSSDTISENLTIEKISEPIAEFSVELLKLKEPAQNLRAEFSQLSGSSNSASKGLSVLDTSITELTKKIGDEIRASELLVETNNRLSEVGKLNVNLLEDKQETLVEVNKQLTRLRNGTGKAAENYQLVADATIGVVDSSVELQTELKAISNLIQNVSKDVAALVATTNSLGVSVSSSSKNLDALVQKSMVVTSEFSKTTTAVSDANSKISEMPKSLENTLTALNVLNGALNETSKSAQPIVQSLQNMTTPLDDATESTKSLQIAIATLNKDIELISRILAQAALKN